MSPLLLGQQVDRNREAERDDKGHKKSRSIDEIPPLDERPVAVVTQATSVNGEEERDTLSSATGLEMKPSGKPNGTVLTQRSGLS